SSALSIRAPEDARANRAVRALPRTARRDREDARAGLDLVLRDADAEAPGGSDAPSGARRGGVQRRSGTRGRRGSPPSRLRNAARDGSAAAVLQAAKGDRPHVLSQRSPSA